MQNTIKLFTILYTLYSILYTPGKVIAANEFSTSYATVYTFDTQGDADISHTIELRNNLSHIYPTEYTLALSTGDLQSLAVKVGNQLTEFSKEQSETITTIHIPIKNANIGKDQITTINLTYRSLNLAEKIGDTYTITLPRTQKGNEATSFTRTLRVPSTYPELKVSSLQPQSTTSSDSFRDYIFVGGGGDSLTALFGESVTYNLNLAFLLKNNSAASGTTEIALPPDTAYQQVILNKIEPKPFELVLDPDGNWLARYNISSLEKLTVNANLQITVDPNPIYFDPSTSLPDDPKTYWEQSSAIKNLARQLKTPKNIYQYLLDTFTYDYAAITNQKRLGAETALKSPTNAICTEFTDTFIALNRSLNIPSRALIGYAYTSDPALRPQAANLDILHAYPEYYDQEQKVWRAVDPTWGHTTGNSSYFDRLDFSHITFVRWGNESSYPLPPGSYRESNDSRQIDVTVSPETPPKPEISYRLDQVGDTTYVINTGKAAIIKQNLTINDQEIYVTYVPPYGRFRIELTSKTPLDSKLIIITTAIIITSLTVILFFKLRAK